MSFYHERLSQVILNEAHTADFLGGIGFFFSILSSIRIVKRKIIFSVHPFAIREIRKLHTLATQLNR